MIGLKHAGSFRDLIVYQKSRQLQREIFRVTNSFPRGDVFIDRPDPPLFPLCRIYYFRGLGKAKI
jgi:hypothetical protein